MKLRHLILLVGIIFISIVSCEKTGTNAPDDDQILEGPLEGLTSSEKIQFLHGDDAFGEVFTQSTGLGPVFVANQCATCHVGDGKGSPFVKLTRFGQSDNSGNQYLNQGGPQLQYRALPGYEPEVLPAYVAVSSFIAPAVTGLGFLDAVSDADIISMSDPDDLDNDGISGKVHWNEIPEYIDLRPNTISNAGKFITRFGKKASTYNLLQQVAKAYNQDIGITSDFEPIDPYSQKNSDPEISIQKIRDVEAYIKTLRAPIQRNQDDPDVKMGKQHFIAIGCANCHVPTLTTGESSISALSYKEFHPYTDLLLHDMGPGLDDGYTEGNATTAEWRTTPLWGIGLAQESQGGSVYLLHDGRVNSIRAAFLFHGGEALQAKNNFLELSETEQNQMIKFLESL